LRLDYVEMGVIKIGGSFILVIKCSNMICLYSAIICTHAEGLHM